MNVIGVGLGRTGTNSLKLALNRLGLGPCHHMDEVLRKMPEQVPLWAAAVDGRPDWSAIYSDYESAVDWPTAGFFRELAEAFPAARFVLTHRDPERWADSFRKTIYRRLAERHARPPEVRDCLEMASAVIEKTGIPVELDRRRLIEAFVAHSDAVRAVIPADQLLEFEVREGWEPLCGFLELPVPDDAFPHTNSREEFWARRY
ncbi:MAG: sulfotransferase family protein [Woeseiaceae bacterium]